jgi:Sulfotransferase family
MKKIAIFGVPRSGTSWLSQIFNSHPDVALRFQPLFSFAHKGRLTEQSSREEINQFFDEILQSQDAFALMKADMHKSYPVFDKADPPTHIVFKEMRYLHIIENMLNRCPDVRIIGIVRNPLACLASWTQAPKEFNPEWDMHSEWRTAPRKNQNRPEEFYGFDKWKEVAGNFLRYQMTFKNQFKLVRYDRLNADPVETSADLFRFCGLSMHPQVREFIKASHSMHDANPYSVFRAKASDTQWKNVLPADIVDGVQRELKDTPLNTFIA